MTADSAQGARAGRPRATARNRPSKLEAIRSRKPATSRALSAGATSSNGAHASGRAKWSQSSAKARSGSGTSGKTPRHDSTPTAGLGRLVGGQGPAQVVHLVVAEVLMEPGL